MRMKIQIQSNRLHVGSIGFFLLCWFASNASLAQSGNPAAGSPTGLPGNPAAIPQQGNNSTLGTPPANPAATPQQPAWQGAPAQANGNTPTSLVPALPGSTQSVVPGTQPIGPNQRPPTQDPQTQGQGTGPDANQATGTTTSNPQDRQTPNLTNQEGAGTTKVTKRLGQLPNSAGQVWREYDITPYSSQITNSDTPQQAILDWILLETGTEMWFQQPLGILHANKNHVYVYHTPEIQSVVKNVVDRFVRTRGQIQNIDLSLVTIGDPNWRAQSYTMLQPVDVRTPGVEAWMISKENAAILQGQLRQRYDFKLHNSGTLSNHDGQKFEIKKTKPLQFVRSLRWVPNQVPNYQPVITNIEEGYSLAISCLTALNSHTIEATIECEVNQVEKLKNVRIDLPGPAGTQQQMNLQIPQLVSWKLRERLRWPDDQVLLLSCGVVATPEPEKTGGLKIPGLTSKSSRADALLFFEYRGPASGAAIPHTADNNLAPIRPRQ